LGTQAPRQRPSRVTMRRLWRRLSGSPPGESWITYCTNVHDSLPQQAVTLALQVLLLLLLQPRHGWVADDTISVGLTWTSARLTCTDSHFQKQARKPTGVGGAWRPPAPAAGALAPATQAAIGGAALPRGTSAPSAIRGRADAPAAAAAAAIAGGGGSGSGGAAGWLRRRGCPGASAQPGRGRRGGAAAVSAGRGLGCAGGAAE